MFYSQWINFVLIFGLISSSYQFNRQNNRVRHYKRDSEARIAAQNVLNKIINDQGQISDSIQKGIDREQQTIKTISQTILTAAKGIATAGVKDTINTAQWESIRAEILNGVNVIIKAYRNFINLHRETCESIENVAKNTITKYESELSVIDQLSAPSSLSSSSNDYTDPSDPRYNDLFRKFMLMMKYAQFHANSLDTALDCAHGLTRSAIAQHEAVRGPATQTTVIHIIHSATTDTVPQTYQLPCSSTVQYNGYETCSSALADASGNFACQASGYCPYQQYKK